MNVKNGYMVMVAKPLGGGDITPGNLVAWADSLDQAVDVARGAIKTYTQVVVCKAIKVVRQSDPPAIIEDVP